MLARLHRARVSESGSETLASSPQKRGNQVIVHFTFAAQASACNSL